MFGGIELGLIIPWLSIKITERDLLKFDITMNLFIYDVLPHTEVT